VQHADHRSGSIAKGFFLREWLLRDSKFLNTHKNISKQIPCFQSTRTTRTRSFPPKAIAKKEKNEGCSRRGHLNQTTV
jgi:hypothetical protein